MPPIINMGGLPKILYEALIFGEGVVGDSPKECIKMSEGSEPSRAEYEGFLPDRNNLLKGY